MNRFRLFYWTGKPSVLGCLILFFCWSYTPVKSQEFKTLKCYQEEMGVAVLRSGTWLKKDRKKNNKTWKAANLFNLTTENGFEKYQSIRQIRDFYSWFDTERILQGRHFKSLGIAAVAAKQLSKVDNGFIRFFIVRNSEVVCFVNDGSQRVFEFNFSGMRQRYFSKEKLSKKKAALWDQNHGIQEQCQVLCPLYESLSEKALCRLDKMAKGKGIFKFGVPKRLRYKGDLSNCEHRFRHGATLLLKEYDKQQ